MTPDGSETELYGEFDINIPFGYDNRILVLDYGENGLLSGFVLTNTHEVLPEEPDTPDAPDDSEPETAPDTDGTKTASGGHTRREASSQSPKTGDDTNVLFWAALLIGAGLGVTALVYGEQKHKRRR